MAAQARVEEQRQDFMVPLSVPVHQDLQDESIRQSRKVGRKVPMTEIARRGIERELRRLKQKS